MSDRTEGCKFKSSEIDRWRAFILQYNIHTPAIRVVKVAGLAIPRVSHLTVAQRKENAAETNLGFYYQLNIH